MLEPAAQSAEGQMLTPQRQGLLGLAPRDNRDKKVVHLGTLVDDEFDSPTWQHDNPEQRPDVSQAHDLSEEDVSEEDFEIPTFLRKRMD
jgi:hypothetical protein